jgi:hypothetical protein
VRLGYSSYSLYFRPPWISNYLLCETPDLFGGIAWRSVTRNYTNAAAYANNPSPVVRPCYKTSHVSHSCLSSPPSDLHSFSSWLFISSSHRIMSDLRVLPGMIHARCLYILPVSDSYLCLRLLGSPWCEHHTQP